MLHRFLLRGCRRGHMPRSFSLLGFNFGVNFRCFGERSVWHFICTWAAAHRSGRRDGDGWVKAKTSPRLALCTRIAPWSYRLWCLAVCLSVCLSPGSWSQVPALPAFLFPFAFLVRFVFVSPSQFCWLRLRLCVVFFSHFFLLLPLSLSLFRVLVLSSCNQKSIIDAFGPKTLWGQPQHLCIEPEPENTNTPMTLVD